MTRNQRFALPVLLVLVGVFVTSGKLGAEDPASQARLKPVLDADVYDRTLELYGAAENDCTKTQALLTKAGAAASTRVGQREFGWLNVWMAARLASNCPLAKRGEILRGAWAKVKDLKLATDHWSVAAEALGQLGYGDFDKANALSLEAMKTARDHPLVLLTRAEVLYQRAAAKAGAPGEVSQAISLTSEALRGTLPKSINQLANLMLARLEELNKDSKLALQYYKTYALMDSTNQRVLLKISELSYTADDCIESEQAAIKAKALGLNQDVDLAHVRAKACVESKAAQTLLTDPKRTPASTDSKPSEPSQQ